MNTENNILKLDTDVGALSENNNEVYASAYRERMNIHV